MRYRTAPNAGEVDEREREKRGHEDEPHPKEREREKEEAPHQRPPSYFVVFTQSVAEKESNQSDLIGIGEV